MPVDKYDKNLYYYNIQKKGSEEEEYVHNPDRENHPPAERWLRKCVRKVASEPEY